MSNEETLTGMYLAIRGSLARMVSRIVPPKEIEDIVQETYVRVCQVKRRDSIDHPRSFLMRTARNLALDHLKRAESRLTVGMDEEADYGFQPQPAQDPIYDQVAGDEEFAHFCEAVRQLPVQCRRAFVLKKVYGYTQKEIARELNISENTVEKHIATGIKRCTLYMMARRKNASDFHGQPARGAGKGGRS